jgi:hypothetical protein
MRYNSRTGLGGSDRSSLKSEVNRLHNSLNRQWRNDQWISTFETLEPEEDTKAGDESNYSISRPGHPGENRGSDSEKGEDLVEK